MNMTHLKGSETVVSTVHYCKRSIGFEITNEDGFYLVDLTLRYNDEDGVNTLTEFEYDFLKDDGGYRKSFCSDRTTIGSEIADEFKKRLTSLTESELQKISSQVDAIIVQVCDDEGIVDDI